MRFGICTDSVNIDIVERLGYDFIELGLTELAPEQPEEAFAPVRDRVLAAGIKPEVFSRLFPREIMLVGPDAGLERVRRYIEVALQRAAELGGKLFVFGSPQARNVPDGFPMDEAMDRLVEIIRFMGREAARNGGTIVVEPLRRSSTNTIWTVQEGFDLAKRIGLDSVKTMADIYQMVNNDEPLEQMKAAGDLLYHVHVSDPDRKIPGNPEHFDFYRKSFSILREMEYSHLVSIEGRPSDFEAEARRGLSVLKTLWGE